jgi:hypothetical protein
VVRLEWRQRACGRVISAGMANPGIVPAGRTQWSRGCHHLSVTELEENLAGCDVERLVVLVMHLRLLSTSTAGPLSMMTKPASSASP